MIGLKDRTKKTTGDLLSPERVREIGEALPEFKRREAERAKLGDLSQQLAIAEAKLNAATDKATRQLSVADAAADILAGGNLDQVAAKSGPGVDLDELRRRVEILKSAVESQKPIEMSAQGRLRMAVIDALLPEYREVIRKLVAIYGQASGLESLIRDINDAYEGVIDNRLTFSTMPGGSISLCDELSDGINPTPLERLAIGLSENSILERNEVLQIVKTNRGKVTQL